ncbi:MAG: hypothetical protein CMJ18_07310 [Phycisphaeraceae bacterium]|nr:hypothetical protein [Phycisphaeraceae bacterium]
MVALGLSAALANPARGAAWTNSGAPSFFENWDSFTATNAGTNTASNLGTWGNQVGFGVYDTPTTSSIDVTAPVAHSAPNALWMDFGTGFNGDILHHVTLDDGDMISVAMNFSSIVGGAGFIEFRIMDLNVIRHTLGLRIDVNGNAKLNPNASGSSGVTVGTPGVGTGWHLFDIEVSNGTARARMNGGAYSSTIPFTPPGPQARIDLKNTATRGGFDDVRITLIPEPASLALIGLGGLMTSRHRR